MAIKTPEAAVDILDAKMGQLRELIREANGTLNDIRQERKKTEGLIKDFREQTEATVKAILEAAVKEGLDDLSGSISKAIGTATDAVNNRFDVIAAICLGDDKPGETPTEELIRRYIRHHGPIPP